MKTKSIILLVALLFVCALTLISCKPEHQHTWVGANCETPKTCSECGVTEGAALGHVEETLAAKPATCTEAGLTEGKKCSVCDKVLVAQEDVKALGHDIIDDEGKAPTCTETGFTAGTHCSRCDYLVDAELIEALGHTDVIDAAVAPTCTETGLTEGKHCSVCEAVLVAQETVSALGHTEVIDAAVASTCTETGLTEGKHCSECGYVIIAQSETALAPHTEAIDAAVPSTCTQMGLTEGKHCSKCNEVLVAQEVAPLAPHTEAIDAAVAPKCLEKGLTEGKHCSECNVVLVAQQVVPATGHTVVVDEAVAPDCLNTGLTEGKHCSECGKVLVAQKIVYESGHKDSDNNYKCDVCEAHLCNAHTPSDAVIENVIDPTCTSEGSYDRVVYCSVCHIEVLRRTVIVEKLPHTVVTDARVEPDCLNTGLTEGNHCSVCDTIFVAQQVIPALGHKDENGDYWCDVCGDLLCLEHAPADAVQENYVAPKCEVAGSYDSVIYCSKCGEQLSRVNKTVDALVHDYAITYTWSLDSSTCTAVGICRNDSNHVVSETSTVNSIKLSVTSTKVLFTYYVSFANGMFAVQSKSIEEDVDSKTNIATVYAPAIQGRVASHDYVKFDFIDKSATYEFIVYYSELSVWDGTSVSTGLAGSGTEADPYLIQSAADLAYIKSVVDAATAYTQTPFKNKYIKMTKSIDLNGASFIIGYHKAWNNLDGFSGIFDGNNCTIRGLNIDTSDNSSSAALFACVQVDGVVKNLSVYGNVKGGTSVGAGGVVAYLKGRLENVTNYASVTGKNNVGGVVYNYESSAHISTGLVNYGSVTASGYLVGGIAGSYSYSLSNSTNWGTITNGGDSNTGGIAGACHNDRPGILDNCYNYGIINNNGKVAGVIVGKVNNHTITNCNGYNTITVNYVKVNGGVAAEAETYVYSGNGIYTIYAKDIAGYVPSHDYVKGEIATGSSAITIYYSEVSVWDGTSVSTGLAGSGTEADPYLIESGADLKYIADIINALAGKGSSTLIKGKYYKMTKSIDLNGHALHIGTGSGWSDRQIFNGHIDGNNCTIRGLNNTLSLFGCVEGTIKNLSLYGNLNTNKTSIGALVGYLYNSSIENITSYVTVKGTGNLGGIVGNMQQAAAKVSKNLVNYGNVTGTNCVGGIAGLLGGGIADSVNWGTITNTNTSGTGTGGIAGSGNWSSNVTNSINYGVINSVGSGTAGIIGKTIKDTTATITNCVNNGTISGAASSAGIFGMIEDTGKATITGCTNNGNVTGTNTTGGIAGKAVGTFENCTNNGDIIGSGWSIAGVVGNVTGTISGCVNNGNVDSAAGGTGGIAGDGSGLISITNSTNNGNITATGKWGVGGIFGNSINTSDVISDCVNTGTIKSAGQLGGIVGKLKGTVSNCTNKGTVQGTSDHVGGIVGHLYTVANETAIKENNNNKNEGSVSSTKTTSKTIGEIIGNVAA